MEDQVQQSLSLENSLIDGLSFSELLQHRRDVLPLFLHNPGDTYLNYPELGLELITFFSRSSNPHVDQTTGYSVPGREPEYQRWEATRQWALEKLKG